MIGPETGHKLPRVLSRSISRQIELVYARLVEERKYAAEYLDHFLCYANGICEESLLGKLDYAQNMISGTYLRTSTLHLSLSGDLAGVPIMGTPVQRLFGLWHKLRERGDFVVSSHLFSDFFPYIELYDSNRDVTIRIGEKKRNDDQDHAIIKEYSRYDSRCHKLMLIVLHWAETNGLTAGYNMLEDRGWMFWVLNYMLSSNPLPLVPNLQYLASVADTPRDLKPEAWIDEGERKDTRFARIMEDKRTAMSTVIKDGLALEKCSIKYRDDGEVVLAAVKHRGLALQFASLRLQRDQAIALEAVRQDPRAIAFYKRHNDTALQHSSDVVYETARKKMSKNSFKNALRDPDYIRNPGGSRIRRRQIEEKAVRSSQKVVEEREFCSNTMSIASLFMGFLRHMATMNTKDKVIDVKWVHHAVMMRRPPRPHTTRIGLGSKLEHSEGTSSLQVRTPSEDGVGSEENVSCHMMRFQRSFLFLIAKATEMHLLQTGKLDDVLLVSEPKPTKTRAYMKVQMSTGLSEGGHGNLMVNKEKATRYVDAIVECFNSKGHYPIRIFMQQKSPCNRTSIHLEFVSIVEAKSAMEMNEMMMYTGTNSAGVNNKWRFQLKVECGFELQHEITEKPTHYLVFNGCDRPPRMPIDLGDVRDSFVPLLPAFATVYKREMANGTWWDVPDATNRDAAPYLDAEDGVIDYDVISYYKQFHKLSEEELKSALGKCSTEGANRNCDVPSVMEKTVKRAD